MKKGFYWVFVLVLIALPFAYALYLYPSLPAQIPIHFNIKGEADGWGAKESIFLMPSIMGFVSLFVFFIFTNIKQLDPKRYADADPANYLALGLAVVIFLCLLSLFILHSIVNVEIRSVSVVFVMVGIAFSLFGLYMPKVKQNYFVGLRLPWTLDNEDNWNATHQYAGKMWAIGGVLMALSALFFEGAILLIVFFSLVFLIVILPVIFSYHFFKKTNK